MKPDFHQKILLALLVVMRPLARIMLRSGIGFREFSEVAKLAFVDVATKEYGIRGRPTNISRVAVMTGLTRKEVKRLRVRMESDSQVIKTKATPLSDVMHRWHSEDEFLDSNGSPKTLAFGGENGTFSALVKRFGGDIPPGAMRTVVNRLGAIREHEDGALEIMKRSVAPDGLDEKMLVSLLHGAYPMLSTIAHNLDPNRTSESWPQITASTKFVRKSDMGRIRRISEDRLNDIAESFDDLFMAYETLHESESSDGNQNLVAVGAFYFEESGSPADSSW